MPPTTYATERSSIATVLLAAAAAAGGVLINWPNGGLAEFPGRTLPTPTEDPSDPARWWNVEIAYENAEQITFGGDVQTNGVVKIQIHLEADVGDGKMREMTDALIGAFRAGDADGITYLEPDAGEPGFNEEGDWYIRQIEVPFIRFKD